MLKEDHFDFYKGTDIEEFKMLLIPVLNRNMERLQQLEKENELLKAELKGFNTAKELYMMGKSE